jgi:hopene-associated glycosyltransferase HpnB
MVKPGILQPGFAIFMLMNIFFIILLISFFIWLVILLLPWQPWRTCEQWEPVRQKYTDETLKGLTILIPARNEAAVIEKTISSIIPQASDARIIVIDDNSEDRTAQFALDAGSSNVSVLEGVERPPGWSGKLWALEQGRKKIQTDTVMLLDADIELKPNVVGSLYKRLHQGPFSFLSLMSKPSLNGFWDTLLMPAFIYFFKLLYPFKLANSGSWGISAAAGGCVMMKTKALEDIGGFASIKETLIDDCALAQKVKDRGYRTWLGLTHSAQSSRPYSGFYELWNMVARTAYTQLHYSISLLLLCTVLMALVFLIPVAGLFTASNYALIIPVCSLIGMIITFIPILRYYNLSVIWAFVFPITALLFLAMTWTSAIRYWKGERMRWRGRVVTSKL